MEKKMASLTSNSFSSFHKPLLINQCIRQCMHLNPTKKRWSGATTTSARCWRRCSSRPRPSERCGAATPCSPSSTAGKPTKSSCYKGGRSNRRGWILYRRRHRRLHLQDQPSLIRKALQRLKSLPRRRVNLPDKTTKRQGQGENVEQQNRWCHLCQQHRSIVPSAPRRPPPRRRPPPPTLSRDGSSARY